MDKKKKKKKKMFLCSIFLLFLACVHCFCNKREKTHFNQPLEGSAPKCWSKFTAHIIICQKI